MTDLQFPKRMASGKYVDLGNLRVEDIDLFDIDTSLNTLYRFTGHYRDVKPLTVAQHTKLTMNICDLFYCEHPFYPFLKLDCLMHDMPEAYYGDISTPLKRLFPGLSSYTKNVDEVVYTALWPYDKHHIRALVYSARKFCDNLSLDIERRCMWKSQIGKSYWPPEPENTLSLSEKRELFEWVTHTECSLEEYYDELIKTVKK